MARHVPASGARGTARQATADPHPGDKARPAPAYPSRPKACAASLYNPVAPANRSGGVNAVNP